RRYGARACHRPQARAHDGRRRDRDERAGQRLGVHGAPAGRLDTVAKATDGPIELGGPVSELWSKPETLGMSKCFPVCPRKRTPDLRVLMSTRSMSSGSHWD